MVAIDTSPRPSSPDYPINFGQREKTEKFYLQVNNFFSLSIACRLQADLTAQFDAEFDFRADPISFQKYCYF